MVALQMLAKPEHLGNRRFGDVCDHDHVSRKDGLLITKEGTWRSSFRGANGLTTADEGFPCHMGWSGDSDGMSVVSTACPTPVLHWHGQTVFEDDALPMRLEFVTSCPPGNFSKWDLGGEPMKVENVVSDFSFPALKTGVANAHWDQDSEPFGSHHKDEVLLAHCPESLASSLESSQKFSQNVQMTQPIVISCTEERDVTRIEWTVDARKIKGTDKVIVSPPFEVPSLSSAVFKMMITPKFVMEGKGGASFKKSKGKGTVQLKCESQLDDEGALVFQISAGCEESTVLFVCQEEWNFADVPLYHCQDEWDFNKCLDITKRHFSVIVEVTKARSKSH
jgi:hypothetical protein